MKSFIQNAAAGFLRKQKNHERYVALLVCLSLFVGLGTWVGLRLTGIARNYEEKVLECPLDVHIHIQDCYDENNALICGRSDFVLHKHNLDCYDGNGVLVCQLGEHEEHRHDESCYQTEQRLICDKAEVEAHTHGEECYQDAATLTCAVAEHTHTESCTQTEQTETARNLICTQAEHLHGDGCYGEDGALTCAETEHTHGDECWAVEYETKSTLTCAQEEHTHGESCYTTEKQLLCEKTEIAADDPAVHQHGDGCYETVKTLLCEKAELIAHEHTEECCTPVEDFEKLTGEERAAMTGRGVDLAHLRTVENAEGKPAYLTCGQTELLVHTHAGDCFRTVTLSGDEVEALAPEQPVEEETDDTFIVEQGSLTTRVAEDETMKVTAAYGIEAGIPEDSFLRAAIVSREDERYTRRAAQTQEVLGMTEEEAGDATMTLLDIGFYRVGADGVEVEVEPRATVTVTIQMKENGFAVGDPITVVHFPEDADGEAQPPEVLDAADVTDEGAATFATDSFSDFMLTTYAAPRAATTYTKYTGDGSNLNGKNVVIVSSDNKAMNASLTGTAVTPNGNDLTTSDTAIVWTFEESNGKYKIKNGSGYLKLDAASLKAGNNVGSATAFTLGGNSGSYTLSTNVNYRTYYIDKNFSASNRGQANFSLYVEGTSESGGTSTGVTVSFQNNDTAATSFILTYPDNTTRTLTADTTSELLKDASGKTSFVLTADGEYTLTKQGETAAVYTFTISNGTITSPTGLTATAGVYTLAIPASSTGGNEGGSTGSEPAEGGTKVSFTNVADDTENPLSGGTFTLTSNENVNPPVNYDLTGGADGILKNGETGEFTLPAGSYTLTQKTAAEGYQPLDTPVSFSVDATTGGIKPEGDYGGSFVVEGTVMTRMFKLKEYMDAHDGTLHGLKVAIADSAATGSGNVLNNQVGNTGTAVTITQADGTSTFPLKNNKNENIEDGQIIWEFEYVKADSDERNAKCGTNNKWYYLKSTNGYLYSETGGLSPSGDNKSLYAIIVDEAKDTVKIGWCDSNRLERGARYGLYCDSSGSFSGDSSGLESGSTLYLYGGGSAPGKPVALTIRNKPILNYVTFTKYKADGKTALPGAEFTLTGPTGGSSTTRTLTSRTDGKLATLDDKTSFGLPKGTYTLTETKAPAGHTAPTGGYQFTVADTGQITAGTNNDSSWNGLVDFGTPTKEEKENQTTTTTTYTYNNAAIKNTAAATPAKLELVKHDESGAALENAGFTLYKAADVTIETTGDTTTVTPKAAEEGNPHAPMWTGTSGSDGKVLGPSNAAFPALADGTYYLLETAVPNGYAKPAAIVITVAADGRVTAMQGTAKLLDNADAAATVQTLTITNRRSTVKVEFVKVSTDNPDTKLAGAEFDLYKAVGADVTGAQNFADGNAQGLPAGDYLKVNDAKLTSNDTGSFGSQNLEIGTTYYLVETKAPDGYLPLTGPVTITTNNGAVATSYSGATGSWAVENTPNAGYTISVPNGTGQRLPDTGGAGSEPYTMSGLLLIGCALVYRTLKGRRVRKS